MENEPVQPATQWDGSRYDSRHAYVWRHGAGVVELLSPQSAERILDIGCGTGHLTAQIAASGARVIGLDRSPGMIEQARKLYPHIEFILADARDFHFSEFFNAVFSNATLHWIKEPGRVADCIYQALKPGGRFVAEFGGRGNIQSIVVALYQILEATGYPVGPEQNPWYYPTIAEYAGVLESHGLSVTYAILFDRPTLLDGGEQGMQYWLEMFAGDFLTQVPADRRPGIMRDIEDRLRSHLYRDGAWYADYRRLRIVAIRPASESESS